jgi:hypothetical protein
MTGTFGGHGFCNSFDESASNDFVPRDHHAKSVLPDTPDHHDADERGRDILGRK